MVDSSPTAAGPNRAKLANIFALQEQALVNRVEAVRASKKGELIGAELETVIREALDALVPASVRVVAGFVVTPNGSLSSHFDGLLVDTRYPLLAVIAGSALVPLHAVLGAFELKTSLDGSELDKALKKGEEVAKFGRELAKSLSDEKKKYGEELVQGEPIESERASEKLQRMVVDPLHPQFSVLALESKLSQASIAWRLWQARSQAQLLVLRPSKETNVPKRYAGMQIERLGTKGRGPSQHFLLERTTSSLPNVLIRGTALGYGFFLQFTLVQEAIATIAGRGFAAWELDKHLTHYAALQVDLD